MRIAPLAIYTHKLADPLDLKRAVMAEINFTHCNHVVIDACIVYTTAIGELLKGKEPSEVFNLAKIQSREE